MNLRKRLLAYLLTFAMVLSLLPQTTHAADGSNTQEPQAHVHQHEFTVAAPEANAPANPNPVKAEKTGTVLAFTSDAHNTSGNAAANRMDTWIDNVEDKHGGIDAMGFGGDMAGASFNGSSSFWTYTQADMDVLNDQGVKGVYTTGNHEYSMGGDFSYSSYTNGSYSSTETKGQYKVNTVGDSGDDYIIYCLGSVSSSSSYSSQNQISTLTSFLSKAGNDKVIFIITHFPLHQYGSRTTTGASDVIDALNDAVENNGQTIVFLWGHNHTESDTYYDQIYGPGGEDSIKYSSNGTKTIKFYYGAAGCMSDSDYGTGSGYVKGKGLAVTFNDAEGTMNFAYYNASGTDVTESASVKSVTLKTVEPVPATSVTIDESVGTGDDGQPVTISQTVAKGGTLQLHVTFEPANSTSTVTWTSSNEAVATVDANGLVTGKLAGTATITATVADSAKKAVVAATLDVTVAQMYVQTNSLVAGKDYLIASGNSGNVLLLTNEETGTAKQLKSASATVSSDGKLTIDSVEEAKVLFSCVANSNSSQGGFWLTNGGQYLYAASTPGLSMTDNATISSSDNNAKSWHYKGDSKNLLWFFKDTSSQDGYTDTSSTYRYYLDYSAGEYFTDAHVESSSSLSNTETPAVYLFVEDDGSGTTPEDPPAGNTVDITPTTSNPEVSATIAVGETLTINVTNSSTNSGYNYTATLSTSGIAEIQGNSTINIAKNSTGQFTVKGLANGTVDINIQNDQSSSSYQRKGVVHLTVEGSSTPVAATGVEITPESATVKVGKTTTLTATVAPSNATNKNVTWTSSNANIASVDTTGKVIGVAAGTATITVTTEDGGFTDTCAVTVEESNDVKYELATTLEDGGAYLIVNTNPPGAAYALKHPGTNATNIANVNYKTSVTIESGNYILTSEEDIVWTAVASGSGFHLSNGGLYLEGKSGNTGVYTPLNNADRAWTYSSSNQLQMPGGTSGGQSTTYTVRYNSGSNYFQGSSATGSNDYKVYIFQRVGTDPVSGVTLDPTTLNLEVGATGTLTATVLPSTAANKAVTWSSDNETVATVANGVVTAVGAGTATITVTTVDGGKSDTCTVTVTAAETYTYYLAETLEDGGEYLIVNGKTGAVYVVGNTSTGSGTSTGLVGISANVVDDSITLTKANAEKATFTAELKTSTSGAVSAWLKLGEKYLYTASSGGLRISDEQTTNSGSTNNTGKYWHYKADGKDLLWYFKDTSSSDGYTDTSSTYKYYLKCSSSGTFTSANVSTTSLANTDTPAIYLFKKATEKIDVTGVALDPTTATVEAGKTVELTATVSPENATNKGVTWTSSDETIATVSGGVVTGVAAGTATITVTTKDGGFTATCIVTVTAPQVDRYVKVNSIKAGGEYIITNNADVGADTTRALKNPGGSTSGVTISSSNGKTTVTILEGNIIETADNDIVWKATTNGDGFYLTNGDDYLEVYQQRLRVFSGDPKQAARYWTYNLSTDANPLQLRHNGGNSTYSLYYTNGSFSASSSTTNSVYIFEKVSDTPHEHTYGTPTYEWSADNSTCTATAVCTGCTEGTEGHTVTETVTASYAITTAATCLTVGSGTYTATFTNTLFAQQIKEVAIPKLDHNMTHHAAVAPTCTEAGTVEYWSCSLCEKNYSDAAGTTELESIVAPATGHTMTHHDAVAPTCTVDGRVEYWSCSVCNKNFSDAAGTTELTSIVDPATGHSMTHHDAVDATCTETGTVEYWSCSKCGKNFSDAAGTTELATIVAPALSHSMTHHAAEAPTCTEDGTVEYWSCSRCGKNFSDEAGTTELTSIVAPATGHDYGEPLWTWAEDLSSASAKFTCTKCGNVETKNATLSEGPGGDEHVGYTAITASVTMDDQTYTDTQYRINQYTITFDSNGGSAVAAITLDYGTAVTAPANPTKAFYSFDGWTPELPATMPAENMTVTAKWVAKNTYYVVGSMNNWTVSEAYELTANPNNPGEYSGSVALSADDEIKVVRAVAGEKVNADHYPSTEHPGYNGTTDNYTVESYYAGTVTLYFRPDGNFSDEMWQHFGGFFYIEGDHLVTVEVSPAGAGEAFVSRPGTDTATTTAPAGMTLTVHYSPAEGYQLDKIEVGTETLTGTTFTMPAENVTVKVYFKLITWTFDGFTWTGTTAVANYIGSNGEAKTVDATMFESITTQPTCTTDGTKVYTATVTETNSPDGQLHTDTKSVSIEKLGHNMTAHPAVEATCTTSGNSAYWSCDRCNKFFSDAEGANEIAENSCVIAKLGHNMTAHAAKDATCTEDGNSAYWSCDRCNKFFSDEAGEHEIAENSWVIPAKGHTTVKTAAVAATCETAGNSEYWSCMVCGKYFSDAEGNNEIAENSWVIPAKGHTLTKTEAVAATCETAGNSEYWTCTVCGKYFSDAEGEHEIAANSWVIAALDHIWGEPTFEWAADFSKVTATFTCTRDTSHKQNETISEDITSEVTTPATATSTGIRTYTVTFTSAVNGKTYTATTEEVLPILSTYIISGTVTSWTSNDTSAEAKTVTLTLYKGGEVVDEEIVTTTEGTYSFMNVVDGTYTLTVTKKDHAPRTYEVTVNGANVTVNVEIRLWGDVSGDGKVSTIDAAMTNWHVKETKTITDEYTLLCADVIGHSGGDGVQTSDVMAINQHARKIKYLW